LELVRNTKPEIPFFFDLGTLGEEEAVESLKTGARLYLKNRLTRLVPACVVRSKTPGKEPTERGRAAFSCTETGEHRSAGQRHSRTTQQHSGPIIMSAPMLRWGLKPEEMEKRWFQSRRAPNAARIRQTTPFVRARRGRQSTVLATQTFDRDIAKNDSGNIPKAIALESKHLPTFGH